jgi:hypothetical protein
MANVLPGKLPQYLVRLQAAFAQRSDPLAEVIAHARYLCIEDTAYDNWNGGTSGHDVALFLPLDQLGKIDIDEQDQIARDFAEKLNKCARGIENEFFNVVRFEMIDEADPECQSAISFSASPPLNPDALDFWKPGLARVFISHRDKHKAEARQLGEALNAYGFACFVAHDTIKAMKTWRSEILKGLQTMEVMVIYLTDDFQESIWCHQEVGYALGRGTPIVSLKLGSKDPPGFISEVQAARGHANRPIEAAKLLFPLIGEALGQKQRLQEVMVTNFVASPSFIEAKARFDLLDEQTEKLTDKQVAEIVAGFRANDQLQGAGYLTSRYERLRKFMDRTTGKEWKVSGKDISEIRVAAIVDTDLDEDVPF